MARKTAKAPPIQGINGATYNEMLGKSGNGSTPQAGPARVNSSGLPAGACRIDGAAPNVVDWSVGTTQAEASPAGLNGLPTGSGSAAEQHLQSESIAEHSTGTPPPVVGKCPACGRGPTRGPSLSSVEAIEAELARLYREQKKDGLPAHIANARANTLRKLSEVKQQRQAFELQERTANLAAENDAAEAEEKGRV